MDFLVAADVVTRSTWNGFGLVGRVKDFKSLTSLRIWLSQAINIKVRIKYLGGFHVVLVFESNEEKGWFMEKKQLWENVFLSLEAWEGQIVDFERIAWIKVYGVPFCLNVDHVINGIGERFGEVVQLPVSSEADEDLSFILVGILCKSVQRINHCFNMAWKSKVFLIVVEEDTGDWTPDCLSDDDEYVYDDEGVQDNVRMGMGSDDVSAGDIGGSHNGEFMVGADLEEGGQFSNNKEDNNDSIPIIQDTFSKHFLEGRNENDGLKKKRKGFSKKARRKSSCSPLGQDRPKKRAREGDDYFDLDRFIFGDNISPAPTVKETELDSAQEV
ncbi:hypothetical protein HanOQP8_Chr01g0005111 [Helianthus annuus]|nr:hypothetical protein HanOQP8_Chr01g0005111 [Helianthus annuus]